MAAKKVFFGNWSKSTKNSTLGLIHHFNIGKVSVVVEVSICRKIKKEVFIVMVRDEGWTTVIEMPFKLDYL